MKTKEQIAKKIDDLQYLIDNNLCPGGIDGGEHRRILGHIYYLKWVMED